MAEKRRHLKSGLDVQVEKNWRFEVEEDLSFFAAIPQRPDKNFLVSLKRLLRHGPSAHTNASSDVKRSKEDHRSWQHAFILFAIQVLWILERPVAGVGLALELVANVWAANGGLLTTLWRLLLDCLSLFRTQHLVVPAKGSAERKSLNGLIDPRTALFVEKGQEAENRQREETVPESDGAAGEQRELESDGDDSTFPGAEEGRRRTGDVLVMASKLAYESRAVVESVVTESWRMHFVDFYDCWNEFQKKRSTQAFVFMDRPTDARAVVIAWRGTEPFNTYDWSTDIDFSWCKIEGMGRIHVGFLEALGLADRRDMATLMSMRAKHRRRMTPGRPARAFDASGAPLTSRARAAASGLSPVVLDAPETVLAFDDISAQVQRLLRDNPRARLYITGHSLGGALAVLYTAMLFYYGEAQFTDRIAAVYTFGQPRVGDARFAQFMTASLAGRSLYHRVVYCNDLVPRVPFDDALFKFKHWGICFYYDSLFKGQTLHEAPNKNYFAVRHILLVHVTAWWELASALLLRSTYGPEFRESVASILYRALGLLVPGLGGHSLVNYVNVMRLGTPWPLVEQMTQQIRDREQDLRDVQQTLRLYVGNYAAGFLSSMRSFVTGK